MREILTEGFIRHGSYAADYAGRNLLASARHHARIAMLAYDALTTGDEYLAQLALRAVGKGA